MTMNPSGPFSVFDCERIEIQIKTTLDKFDFESFRKAYSESTRKPVGEDVGCQSAVVATRDSGSADYHGHFYWWVSREKNTFRTELMYVKGDTKPHEDDRGPYAEDIMGWLGPFFKYERAEAETQANFKYPKDRYQLLLPIPMKLPTEAKEIAEVQVFGMAVEFPMKLHGMSQAYILSLEKAITISLTGVRTIALRNFDLSGELADLSSVAKMLAREAKQ